MAGTADTLEEFAVKLLHYIESVEQENLDIKRLVAGLGEHFGGELHDKFEAEFYSEIHDPMIPLTEELRIMHVGLVSDIDYVRRLNSGAVDV